MSSCPDQLHVARPPADRPVILFDGECAFCRRGIARFRKTFGDALDYLPSSEGAGLFPEIPAESLDGALQLVELDGRVYSGADAVARALARKPGYGWTAWCYANLPGLAWLARKLYGWVARNRRRL